MSAKQKRPFLIFAAVAAVCCMVLVTGVRSKANESPAPEFTAAPIVSAGSAVERMSGASGRSVPGAILHPERVLRIDSSYGSPAVTTSRGERNAKLSAPPQDERGGAAGRERGRVAPVPVPDTLPPGERVGTRPGMSGKDEPKRAKRTAKHRAKHTAKLVRHAKHAKRAAKGAQQRGQHQRGAGKGHRRQP